MAEVLCDGCGYDEARWVAILDSLIVDIYKNNEYGKQTERDDASKKEK